MNIWIRIETIRFPAPVGNTDLLQNCKRLPTWLEWIESKGISPPTPLKKFKEVGWDSSPHIAGNTGLCSSSKEEDDNHPRTWGDRTNRYSMTFGRNRHIVSMKKQIPAVTDTICGFPEFLDSWWIKPSTDGLSLALKRVTGTWVCLYLQGIYPVNVLRDVDNINIRPDGTGQQTAIRRRWDREKQGDIINDNIINKTEQGTSRSLAYIHRFDNS